MFRPRAIEPRLWPFHFLSERACRVERAGYQPIENVQNARHDRPGKCPDMCISQLSIPNVAMHTSEALFVIPLEQVHWAIFRADGFHRVYPFPFDYMALTALELRLTCSSSIIHPMVVLGPWIRRYHRQLRTYDAVFWPHNHPWLIEIAPRL